MLKPKTKDSDYRPAVGLVIFNDNGEVFIGRRRGQKGFWIWQFPQGGIDSGETPEQAAYRELHEETGLQKSHIEVIGEIEPWLYYDLPKERRKRWRGQKQKWFAVRLLGSTKNINLKVENPPEFSRYLWGSLDDAAHLIVPFKRDVYKRLAKDFKHFAKPNK
ncbi:MAG: RNA pyrophosphohydrolase [Maricaulaceae bacterium]